MLEFPTPDILQLIMNSYTSHTPHSSLLTRITCSVFFLLFSFFFLYHYQADVMAMAQHVLSGGKTSYNRFVGASLITIALYLLHYVVAHITKLATMGYALTFFPSLLLLSFITDISPDIDHGCSLGSWLWLFPLMTLLWVIAVWLLKAVELYVSADMAIGIYSKSGWVNMLTMCLMLVFAGAASNTDEVFHYRMQVEQCLVKRNYKEALEVGDNSLASDSSLTMLRIYALAASGLLPERLFEYPIVGGADAMRPDGNSVKMMLYADTKLRLVRNCHHDYILCAFLLRRDIDGFAKNITKWYKADRSLPKHYREALTLYNHLRSNPVVAYHDNISEADYRDYQDMERKYQNKQERQNMLRDMFGKTYWYYFDYPQ